MQLCVCVSHVNGIADLCARVFELLAEARSLSVAVISRNDYTDE